MNDDLVYVCNSEMFLVVFSGHGNDIDTITAELILERNGSIAYCVCGTKLGDDL